MIGVDIDQHKARSIREGRAPFYEPGLEQMVRDGVAAGLLEATSSTAEALAGASVALLCVGTPSERNGNLSLEQLRRVAAEIGEALLAAERAAGHRRAQHRLSGHV